MKKNLLLVFLSMSFLLVGCYTGTHEDYLNECENEKNGYSCSQVADNYYSSFASEYNDRKIGGDKIERDLTKAKKYYLLACNYGWELGCSEIINIERTFHLLLRAANRCKNNKDINACLSVADSYNDSKQYRGKPKIDYVKAKEYYSLACEYGDKNACEKKNQLPSTLLTTLLNYLVGFFNPSDTEPISLSKAQILNIINEGSHRLEYYMSMPKGMASGTEAEDIATYVANGMKDTQPTSFKICTACHGKYGRGITGVAPSLIEYKSIAESINEAEEICNNTKEKHYTSACLHLGNIYEAGRIEKQNYSKALEFYAKACDGNNFSGCNKIGFLYRYGTSARQKRLKDMGIDTKDCDANSTNGKCMKQNHLKAIEFYTKACDNNSTTGCLAVGDIYHDRNSTYRDNIKSKTFYNKYLDILTKSCNEETGYSTDCYNLANFYSLGKYGLKQDYMKAVEFYGKSCDNGNGDACYKLGEIYRYGKKDVEKDYSKATKYRKKACDEHYSYLCPTKSYSNSYSSDNYSGSCQTLKKKFLDCVYRSSLGLPCKPGTDIVLPARCR